MLSANRRDPFTDTEVANHSLRDISRLSVAFLLSVLAGCASVPPQTPETSRIRIFTEIPAGVVVEKMKDVEVSHGRGCGLFGALGNREGAEMRLRESAVASGADAALITATSLPGIRGTCRVNTYALRARLLRMPVMTYTPPDELRGGSGEFKYTVPSDYDATWSSLVDAVASTFFEVKNYEKDSGLLTLFFEPDTASEYIDCGAWEKRYPNGDVPFAGPYIDWLGRGNRFKADTRINLRVKRTSAFRTEVEITSLYNVQSPEADIAFKFKTNTRSRKTTGDTGNMSPDTIPYRICQSTHKLEHELLDEIQRAATN